MCSGLGGAGYCYGCMVVAAEGRGDAVGQAECTDDWEGLFQLYSLFGGR